MNRFVGYRHWLNPKTIVGDKARDLLARVLYKLKFKYTLRDLEELTGLDKATIQRLIIYTDENLKESEKNEKEPLQ